MSSEILASALKVIIPLLFGGGGLKIIQLVRDARREKRLRPVEETSSAIAITKELQALSRESVAGVRAEMQEMRTKHVEERAEDRRLLEEAREQLRTVTQSLEEREREHSENERRSATLMERMRSRIAQLVQVLTDNHIDVPPEEEVVTADVHRAGGPGSPR